MKIVIAPDSFKGSLSAKEAALAIERGIRKAAPDAETVLVPMADGGEGTVDSLIGATQGTTIQVPVRGPLLDEVTAEYGVLGDQKTCVIEMAAASGLILIREEQRNPWLATTYGTGQLIKHALDSGYRKFILALGGSATNDGGSGMLQALGLGLLDADGHPVPHGAQGLTQISRIDAADWDVRIAQSSFTIASDVVNPFIGPQGASYVFGPQKGATPEMVEELDKALLHWADLMEAHTGIAVHNLPGAGAAGGLGGAFQAFFPSEMRRGVEIVMETCNFYQHLQSASLVFTGEGRTDAQTASGKAPMGIAQAAQKKGVPVVVLSGSIGQGVEILLEHGITSIHSIVNGPMSLQEAMDRTAELLTQKAEHVMRTYLASLGQR
ncbi:glycerate kinase [Paenibacillus planticolens]|uniref:Glycerate kinase n=1 Tax=Paenibacillus planticolens TaxID=2654976 RepID=A0ABX1ZSY7_9BACL|nr:glycerate kinase [Paenibacillus planticolens]NOV02047.1 glycerate kinase [Paenibacillus planticolens]